MLKEVSLDTASSERLSRLNAAQGAPLRLLLVMPLFPPSFWGMHYVARYFGKTCMMPPLGLLTIAGLCPAQWQVRLVDENTEPLEDADLLWADLVAVSSMIVQFDRAVKIAERAHALGKPVMVGGAHPSAEPKVYEGRFDILLRNEGEITFRQFIEDYGAGTVRALYETSEKANFSESPRARYDLLRHPRRYINFCVQFSRGCPHNCEFCDAITIFGRRHRCRSVSQVLGDLEGILRTGYRGLVFFADDNFTASPRRTIELCQALTDWNRRNGNPFLYYTEAAITIAADEELLERLAQARFESVFIGLETFSEEGLRAAGKNQNLGTNPAKAIQKIQSYGIRVDGGFIIGFDTDPPDIIQRQAQFIQEIGVSGAMVGILTAGPSTPLAHRLMAAGRLRHEETPLGSIDNSERYNVGGHINIIPLNQPLSSLIEGYGNLLATIYHPRNYFSRVLQQVFSLKPRRRSAVSLAKWFFLAFPGITLLILFLFPFRAQYCLAAIRVLLRNPLKIREFAFLSMVGIHYMEFARREVVPWTRLEAQRLRAREKKTHQGASAALHEAEA